MQVFKAALRTVLRHPLYLLVYAAFLSLMGVFMASGLSFGGSDAAAFVPYETTFSIIDRDSSDFSQELAAYLRTCGIEVPIEDTRTALQDAVAKGQSSYVLIVPPGFGEALMDAARSGKEAPVLQTVYSYYSLEGSLVDQEVNEYLNLAHAYAGLLPHAPQAAVAQAATQAMGTSAQVQTVEWGSANAGSQRFVFYLSWGTYTLFAAIIVSVGMLMGTLNRTDLRRRNLVSPVTPLKYGLQVGAASLLVTVGVWLWTIGVGLAVFHESAAHVSGTGLTLMLASSLAFAAIPLAVGCLLGQLGVGEFASNAVGNIAGMAVSFLGGVWVSLDLLDPTMQAIAHFSPAYWYTDALQREAGLTSPTLDALMPILGDLGVMLLFAAAIFAVALVVGRMRAQSAEAGGNAGASHA